MPRLAKSSSQNKLLVLWVARQQAPVEPEALAPPMKRKKKRHLTTRQLRLLQLLLQRLPAELPLPDLGQVLARLALVSCQLWDLQLLEEPVCEEHRVLSCWLLAAAPQ